MAITRVKIKPELLRWACERAWERGPEELREKIPKLAEWIAGTQQPTLRELERFADAARVSVGYLFLPSPPEEHVPIPDLRTMKGRGVRRPSPDLLDVLHLCQRRQDWYREYAKQEGETPKPFFGTATLSSSIEEVAGNMRRTLEFGVEDRQDAISPDAALKLFIEKTEDAGVLVMVSGIVGVNTSRKLDSEEFRGFALADPIAPLVFVNGVDGKPAQMFTLAHELAHLFLGGSALSDVSISGRTSDRTEQWCNCVAAEFLVPLDDISSMNLRNPLEHLNEYRNRFKVSRVVILRRLFDAGIINRAEFDATYMLVSQSKTVKPPSKGGDFYNTYFKRASKRFVKALYSDTLEGKTLYREAYGLLGVSGTTFHNIGKKASAE